MTGSLCTLYFLWPGISLALVISGALQNSTPTTGLKQLIFLVEEKFQ